MTTQTATLVQARKSSVSLLRKLPRVLTLLVFFILFVFPIIWIAYNAMKTNNQLFDNPWALPAALNWDNFVYAWSAANVGIYFLNSLKVCVLALMISLLLSTMASFAITRMRWKLAPVVLGLFVASMMIPNNAMLIPQFLLFSKVGLVNKHIALIILYAVAALPISIFILCGFMQAFPTDIEEAAVIDGANMVRMFFYITLPISTSAIATVAIFTFVSMWNDLILALVFINESAKMTLPYGLKSLQGQYTTNYVAIFAAITIAIVPTITIFTIFNKQIIAGVTAGSVKE